MGLYNVECSNEGCNNTFMWWSGNKCQLCPKCIENMGGGYHEIERKFKDPENGGLYGYFYFIGLNEATTYDDAVALLISRGVPEDEIVIRNFNP